MSKIIADYTSKNFQSHHYKFFQHSLDGQPPANTIIIEADINPTKDIENYFGIDTLRQRIISTCGDAKVTKGDTKRVDPALCLYNGIHLICVMDNETLNETPPRGNGTLCKLISVQLKPDPTTLKVKTFNGYPVRTVNVKDVESLHLELLDDTERIQTLLHRLQAISNHSRNNSQIQQIKNEIEHIRTQRRFYLEPTTNICSVNCKISAFTDEMSFKAKFTQFPVNTAVAITGHKLQGRTLENIIITSWPKNGLFQNWEYTVLSRVKSIEGLFLFQELDIHKSYAASDDFKLFLVRLQDREKQIISKLSMNRFNS